MANLGDLAQALVRHVRAAAPSPHGAAGDGGLAHGPGQLLHGNLTNLTKDTHGVESHHADPPYVILFIFVTLVLGVIARQLQPKIPIPYTVVIMILGVIYGVIAAKSYPPFLNYTGMTRIDPHWILHIFLPILIFESSFAIPLHLFRQSIWHIIVLATAGLVVSTFLTAILAKYAFGYDWAWYVALMFGSLVSATDPVAVVALLKEVGASPALGVVLEGESLLNDGTAIILFNIFLALSAPDDGFSAHALGVQSFFTIFGGPLFGCICGWVASFFIGIISNDAISECIISLIAAYLTFYISEAVLGISGVLAVVALGVVMNSQRTVISPEVEHTMHEFWEVIVYVGNTLIFVIVGLAISEHALYTFLPWDWFNLFILYICIIFIRLFSIVIFIPVNRYLDCAEIVGWKNVLVMGWGGLRGAVALMLALAVSRDPRLDRRMVGDKVLILTSGIVLLTLLVNATTTAKMLKFLGMSRVPEYTIKAVDNCIRLIIHHRNEVMSALKKESFLDGLNWDDIDSDSKVRNPYIDAAHSVLLDGTKEEAPISAINGIDGKNDSHAVLAAPLDHQDFDATREVWLKLLRFSVWEQYELGLISRETILYLTNCIDLAIRNPSGPLIDVELITRKLEVGRKLNYWQRMVNRLCGHEVDLIKTYPPLPAPEAISPQHHTKTQRIVTSWWFNAIIFLTLMAHTLVIVINIALNWNGVNNLNEDYFLFSANGWVVGFTTVFLIIYVAEMALSVASVGWRTYLQDIWNKFEVAVVIIVFIDWVLNIYALDNGIDGPNSFLDALKLFDILILLRICKFVRLAQVSVPALIKVSRSLVTRRLLIGFESGKAYLTAQEEAIELTEKYIENHSALHIIQEEAEKIKHKVESELDVLLEERPDIALYVKKRYATRKVLLCMKEDLRGFRAKDLIDYKASSMLQKSLEHKMEKASDVPYRFRNPTKMLARIPWIRNNPSLQSFLMGRVIFVRYPEGYEIISQGTNLPGIFFIISGTVELVQKTAANEPAGYQPDKTECRQHFGEEDLIGEYLFLTGRRSSVSYQCSSRIKALLLPRGVLEESLSHYPNLREAMWNSCGPYVATGLLSMHSAIHRAHPEKVAQDIGRGTIVVPTENSLAVLPEWKTVLLMHGSAVGFPHEIAIKSPQILSSQIHTLAFPQSLGQETGESTRPVLFVIGRSLSTYGRQNGFAIHNEGFMYQDK